MDDRSEDIPSVNTLQATPENRVACNSISEVAYELDDGFVLFGEERDGIGAVEVAFVVDAYVRLKFRTAQAQCHAAGQAMPLRIVGRQGTGVVRLSPAVVGHVVVAAQKGDGRKDPLQRQTIRDEGVRRIHGWEGAACVTLAEVLALDMPAARFVITAEVVHLDLRGARISPLEAGGQMEPAGQQQLCLERKVVIRGPEILLIGQPRTVEDAGFECERTPLEKSVADRGPDVPHIADLLGDERPVGEVLQMGRAVGVDREGHAHLPYREAQPPSRPEPDVGVQHPDPAFVGEVDLGLVLHDREHPALKPDTGIPNLETALVDPGLIFVLGADRGVHLRPVRERVGRLRPHGRTGEECREQRGGKDSSHGYPISGSYFGIGRSEKSVSRSLA